MKQVQRSDARIEVDVMHTRWMNALSKRRGVYQSAEPRQGMHDKRDEGRNTGTRQVCKPRTECSKITKLKTTS
jgi:hypothetical protein